MEIRPYRKIKRRKTKKIKVGKVTVGGDAPISVQSMTNTLTTNVKETIKQPFNMPLQSELTAKLAEQILDCGHSDLTPLDESYLLHRPMLDAFNAHLSSILKEPVTVCPIT